MNMIHLVTLNNLHVNNPFSSSFIGGYIYWDLIGVNNVLNRNDYSEQFGLYCAGGEL